MAPSEAVAICLGVLVRDGSMLLVRRAPCVRVFPGAWDLFGGHVECGEHLEEALRREAREELGIEVRTSKYLGHIDDRVEPSLIHVFAVLSWDGEPQNRAPEEHTDVRWFAIAELPESEALDAIRTLITAPRDP